MVNVGFQIKYLLKSGEPDTSFYKSAYNQKWKPIATDAIEAIKAFYTKSYGSGLLHTIAAMKPIWTEVRPKDVHLGLLNNGLAILQKTHIAQRLMAAFSDGIERGVVALFMCAIALLLWGLLPAKRVHKKHAIEKTLPEYARYFELSEQEIQTGRQQKVSIVHHDENGKIIRVE